MKAIFLPAIALPLLHFKVALILNDLVDFLIVIVFLTNLRVCLIVILFETLYPEYLDVIVTVVGLFVGEG